MLYQNPYTTTIQYKRSADIPIVIVHGMAGTPIYKDPKGPNQEQVGVFDPKVLLSSIREYPNMVKNVVKLASKNTEDSSAELETLIDAISDLVGNSDINCSPDGGPNGIGVINDWVEPLSMHPEYFDYDNGVTRIAKELCKEAGAENVYAFNYDWRLDLYESGAVGLHEFVQAVLERTGSTQISLVCDSLGGATVSCYIDAHKDENVLERVVIVNGALEGVDFASAYNKYLYMDPDEISEYLNRLGSSLNGGQLEFLFFAMSAIFSSMLDALTDNMNDALERSRIQNRIFNDCLKPILGYIPALWECVPYEHFEGAVQSMSEIGYLDTESPLYEKIWRYHEVQGRVKKNLKYLHARGIQVAVVATYGYPGIPLTPNCAKQTDILIETEYESAGATVALSGQKLEGRYGRYVSADLEIDASTCALPDSTWFIKNLRHVNFMPDKPAIALVAGLCAGYYDCDIVSVLNSTGYGQFLLADSNQNLTNITPENSGEEKKLLSFLERVTL